MGIDWNKLQPYKTTKSKSFEQLCYQIAVRMFGSDGRFTPIDDSGGGDGVEFYLTLADGKEWGWQAKYYEGSVRLNVSGRKKAIESSLARATQKHPEMEIWYLCVSLDLTPEENNWVTTELIKQVPIGHPARIVIWNESFIHERLNNPEFSGLKNAFFNSLELSQDWFNVTFKKVFKLVENKFDSILYTPNEEFEYNYVNPLLCDEKFKVNRIAYFPRKLSELLVEGKKRLNKLEYTNDLFRPLFNKYLERYSDFNLLATGLLPKFKERLENLTPNTVGNISGEDFSKEIDSFRAVVSELDDFRRDWYQETISHMPEGDKRDHNSELAKISDVDRVYREFIEELNDYVSHSSLPLRWRSAHFLGNGGDGKTNFAVALATGHFSEGVPAIFIPAILLTGSNVLSDQLLSLLDIKSDYSFAEFLDALDELGRIYNRRIPFILDGLNEAIDSKGGFNERIKLDLPQLEVDFLERKNLVLITTCRISYQEKIWNVNAFDDERFHFLYGFTNHDDKKKLVRRYFKHYKIQADLSFLSINHFRKPLYLKLFCESVNGRRKDVKQLTMGFDSIYQIFENFVDLCDANVFSRIKKIGKLPPTSSYKKVATNVLDKFGKQLWEDHQRAIPLEDLILMADGDIVIDYQNSVTKALLDEELLFVRDYQDGDEHVYLTYDLLAGYFIAKHLLDVVDDFSVFFESEDAQLLIGADYNQLHPNHEDILDGICSLLPIKKNVYLHDLLRNSGGKLKPEQSRLVSKSIETTILLSPHFITEEQVSYLNKLAKISKNFTRMLSVSDAVWFVSSHPFNFNFWSSLLKEMTMNERDIHWSEFIRSLREDFLDDLIVEFEGLLSAKQLSGEQMEKISLVSRFLVWTLTSTSKTIKEKSGSALFKLGNHYPELMQKHFYMAADIGDPYVFEWMCTAMYTSVVYLLKENIDNHIEGLVNLASFLRDEVLTPGGQYATSHLGIRNYSIQTLRLLIKKVPEIRAIIDLENLIKHFSKLGITEWLEEEDYDEENYRDGNSLIGYYFNKEKMPHIPTGLGSEYNPTPEYLSVQAKLRWRAYQLGYEFARFGELDKEIANRKHWGGSFSDTDRYADKYIDIAFQEYCGFLDAQDSFETYQDIGYVRTFKLNFDPMEINELNEDYLPSERFEVKNFIDPHVTLKEWGNDSSVPDLSEFLQRDAFLEKKGDWILMHGLVHQHDRTSQRQFFFKVDTVLVRNVDSQKARKAFSDDTKLGQAGNGIPFTENVHASEVPDGESIPYNEWNEWHYSLTSVPVEVEHTRMVLFRDGERLNEEESDFLWDSIVKNLQVIFLPRTSQSAFNEHVLAFRKENDNQQETIEEALQRKGIEVIQEKFIKSELEKVEEQIEVFVPVRYFKNKVYLCKNMIDQLGLSSPQNSADLIDSDGNLGSFNYTNKVEYVDEQSFTYLRRDVLERYLRDNDLTLYQIIWGERDFYPADGDWTKNMRSSTERYYTSFYKAIEYNTKS